LEVKSRIGALFLRLGFLGGASMATTTTPALKCECELAEGVGRLRKLLDDLEATPVASKKFDPALKQAVRALEDSLKLHVTEFRERYARNMTELDKRNAINVEAGKSTPTPLQTSPWTLGDYRKLMEPPPKKSKKEKRVNVNGAVANLGPVKMEEEDEAEEEGL
jgi:hypothetical protein